MALLNYSKTYQEVLNELKINDIKDLSESNSGNYVKLFFTGEGDIITHGLNYLSLFTTSTTGKGLVPSGTNNQKELLRGSGVWKELTTSDLPMWSEGDYTNNTLLTSLQIKDLINQGFVANDAMVFKGTLGTNGTVTTLPTIHNTGWTYRVITAGTYAGKNCEIGDLIICITNGTSANNDHWTVALTNINGYTINKINNIDYLLYSNSPAFLIFAPTTGGTKDQILFSGGGNNSPSWGNLLAGTGLTFNNKIFSLNTASVSSIGGIKINNILSESVTLSNSVRNYGVLIDKDGKAFVNVPWTDNSLRDIQVGGNSIGTSKLNFMPTGDIYVKIGDQDPNTSDTYDISFGLSWWNISANSGKGAYETV